jgi:integrase
MAARKIKKTWWVDFQAYRKRYRYRSPANTREGAQAFEARLRNELATFGEIRSLKPKAAERPPAPTLTDFVPRWMDGYVIPNNRPKEQGQKRATLNHHLLPVFGKLRLDQITPERIELYKGAKQKEGLHPKTINNQLVILHKLLVTAKEWSLIESVPHTKQLKAPDPPFRHLSKSDTEKLIVAIPDEPWRSMVVLAARTGMRYSELSGLQWEDVDLERGSITVRRSLVEGEMGNTKNNRIRHIPLTPDALAALQGLPHVPGHVFLFHKAPVLYKTARLKLEDYCRLAGVPRITWHDLRHTFASQLAASSAPILAVQKLMGHADIKMTMRYSHLEPDVLRDVVNLLGPR